MNANDAIAARSTRKAAAAALGELTEDRDAIGAAELIVGELLSNAARHADGHVCLELSVNEGYVTLSVHDTSPTFALEIKRPIDEMSESGRGLFIISKLADRIGRHAAHERWKVRFGALEPAGDDRRSLRTLFAALASRRRARLHGSADRALSAADHRALNRYDVRSNAMSVEIKGGAIVAMLIAGGFLAYFVLNARLAQNLAVGFAIFGTCVVSLFVFAFRTAISDRTRGDHDHHH